MRAVVVTGAGDKAFSAGADLKALLRGEKIRHPDHEEWGLAGYVHHFRRPTNGYSRTLVTPLNKTL